MPPTTGRTLNIVAHEDDDLLFLSPDLQRAIQAGRTVRTIFLTAGDGGAGADYWRSRESGVQAAYVQICGVTNAWTRTDVCIMDHLIPVYTLMDHPHVSIVFMRLPDGNLNGLGFPSTNHESLQQLWTNAISTIHTVDHSSSYSQETLIRVLTDLMVSFQPDQINTQDYAGVYGDGDHSDHHSVAYFVMTAAKQYMYPHILTGYAAYTTSSRPVNVRGADFIAKLNAFCAYAQYDRCTGRMPKIFPGSSFMNVRLRQIVFLLYSFARHLLKSMTNFFVSKNTSSFDYTSFTGWLRRQYTVGPVVSGGDPIRVDQNIKETRRN